MSADWGLPRADGSYAQAMGVRTGELVDTPLTEGSDDTSPDQAERPSSRRGTTNGNARGNPTDRERRRAWLVQTYRADVDVEVAEILSRRIHVGPVELGTGQPACRCYRCGRLLTVNTVTVDRIIPGCRGGTYRRDNIRPACAACNSVTGATTRKRRD